MSMLWFNSSGKGMSSIPWGKSLNNSAANFAGYPTRSMCTFNPHDAGASIVC